jgi:hypothetical protein
VSLAFITNSRVSMQRAGMLAVACAASNRRASNLERVTRGLGEIVSHKVELGDDLERFQAYRRSLRLWKRYGNLPEQVEPGTKVELQDVWLADPGLPSVTGALTKEVMSDIPQLAVNLRLLRKGNMSQTDRARALLNAYGEDATAALTGKERAPSPLVLPVAAQLILAYAMLEADSDFLRAAWQTTRVLGTSEFKRADFATGLQGACDRLVAEARRKAVTGADRQLLMRLREWSDEIAKGRGSGPNWGGGRPPDHLATLRLEPYVDLGLIEKLDRAKYRYRVNEAQEPFFRAISETESVMKLARTSLVRLLLRASGRGDDHRLASEDEIWERIRGTYQTMRSRLGFAPFVEVVLLSAGSLMEEDPTSFFEIQNGLDVILKRRRKAPKEVRLTISRKGELTYMKILEGGVDRGAG